MSREIVTIRGAEFHVSKVRALYKQLPSSTQMTILGCSRSSLDKAAWVSSPLDLILTIKNSKPGTHFLKRSWFIHVYIRNLGLLPGVTSYLESMGNGKRGTLAFSLKWDWECAWGDGYLTVERGREGERESDG